MTALAALLAARPPEASRAPSLVVTIFGDAIVPRGGSVGLATLTAILGSLGIAEGAVRTATSRLAAESWLARVRRGRHSFYRLAPKGEAVFAAATEHIYDPPEPAWDGRLALHLAAAGDAALWRQNGFGEAAPGVFVAPSVAETAPPAPGLRLDATGSPAVLAELAARAWNLENIAGKYAEFLATFADLVGNPAVCADPLDALRLRILLIHDYRRVILRDPILPPALLPSDWPGFAARHLCASLYRAVLPASESWLDLNAAAEAGPLPPPSPALAARFGTRDSMT